MDGEIDNQNNPVGFEFPQWSWMEWLMLGVERLWLGWNRQYQSKEVSIYRQGEGNVKRDGKIEVGVKSRFGSNHGQRCDERMMEWE